MRRALVVACLLALFGASPANAKVIAEVGFRSHPRPPGRGLKLETGILASPAPLAVSTGTIGGGSSWLSAAQVASYARAAGFPEWAIPQMVAYAYRESHFNAHAINLSSGACGLWQLYPCPGLSALDPAVNSALAYAKFQASGFAPWGGTP